MKTKLFILAPFILFSVLSFGQESGFQQNPTDSSLIKFTEKIYSLERTALKKKIYPSDTVNIENKQFKLKYIEKIGYAPTYEEIEKFNSNITYSCEKFGDNYVVINLSRNTGMVNRTRFFYEKTIRKNDENFIQANITKTSLSNSDTSRYTRKFKDYGNSVANNVSLINQMNLLDFVLKTNHNLNFCCSNCEALTKPKSSIPIWRIITKDKMGNFISISKCGYSKPSITSKEQLKQKENFTFFEYDSFGKLCEVKTKEYLYKIEWLQ